ncbi:MAG: sulfatase [Planctomycetales bacterium]|nr:sulfatase [Planctomycetales bacterium]
MTNSFARTLSVAVIFCTFLPSALHSGRAHAAGRPNVLYIIADDLNCDLGCYGHPQVQSPNIDRLARRGVRFERAYCQYPLCGPSRASFMCGLYPDQTLIHRNAIRIREHVPEVQTMSQLFRNNGYTAMRIGKIYHYNVPKDIGNDGHDDPGSWDRVINPRGRDKDDEPLIFSLRKGQFGGTLSWLAADGADEEQTDGIASDHATKLLRELAKSKEPFYLAVGFYRPHTPYVAPKKYFDLYPLEKIVVPEVPAGYLETLPGPARASLTRKKEQVNLADDLARQAIQAYYASITFMDAQLGRVLDVLEETGLDENTIVLFTSDHGYHMGEHGYYQKTTLFENAAHVPLIISAPGMKSAGQATGAPAEMIDFYPTLAELAELAPPDNLSGISQAPVLRDVQARPRTAALTQFANGYSLRTERYRYTEWGEDGAEGNELYDHETDPAEMRNLAASAEHKQTIAELSAQLQKRIAQARRVPQGLKQIPERPAAKKPRR